VDQKEGSYLVQLLAILLMWNQQEKMLSAEKMVMSKMIKTSFWLL
jgi:uncharacterized membrane-anchored protein